MRKSQADSRHELDINIKLVLMIALALTFSTYALVFFARDSYLGQLLYSRGFTQYIVVFLASFVIGTAIDKYVKIQNEFKILQRMFDLPNYVSFKNHTSSELTNLQHDLSKRFSMVTSRINRLVGAYISSGSRKACSEFALDDSAFYLTASESSYTLPRILVWAIPLLGFIGTVLGISSAVNGFSGFLDNAAEIDQIKEGIGTVTSGLAVAFDTTLLALLLSVLVMIPLVLVERMESKLLLATDVFVNDQLLPQFRQETVQKSTPILDVEMVEKTITNTLDTKLPSKEEFIEPIKEALPTPEELVKPAEIYAQEVAKNLTTQFLTSFQDIQNKEQELVAKLKEINEVILSDRQQVARVYQEQQNLNGSILKELQEVVSLVSRNSQTFTKGFNLQTKAITTELNKASQSLNSKITALEEVTGKIAELNNLTHVLNGLTQSIHNASDMEKTLLAIQENITNLKPTLNNLGKPRVIRLVEQIEQE